MGREEIFEKFSESHNHINDHHEQIYKNISATNEDIEKLGSSQNMIITTYNKETKEMDINIQELLKWKSEMTEEADENLIKTETIGVNENTESNPEFNIEEEMDIETDAEDEITTQAISTEGVEMRFKWYEFSAMFVTEEYKVQYIQPNAKAANRKKIFAWYDACCRIDLVPDEFKVDEEKESEEENEVVEENESEENKQSRKKAFHKQRKEEWRKRKSSKNVFKVSEEVVEEKKENKNKKHVFSRNSTRPLL